MAKHRASDSVMLLAVLMVIAIITIHTCYQAFASIERLMNELLAPAKDQSTENVVPADGERTALGSWSARNNSNLPELFANGDLSSMMYDRQRATICRFIAESPPDDLN